MKKQVWCLGDGGQREVEVEKKCSRQEKNKTGQVLGRGKDGAYRRDEMTFRMTECRAQEKRGER